MLTHYGRKVKAIQYGLGRRTTIFDAELFALTTASHHTYSYVTSISQPITTIHFFTDNTSAIHMAYDRRPHAGQLDSELFSQNIDELLSTYPSLRITIHWCPAHKGIKGNEYVDNLTKHATTIAATVPATISYLTARAHCHTLHQWHNDWHITQRNNAPRQFLTKPPSLTLNPIFRDQRITRADSS